MTTCTQLTIIAPHPLYKTKSNIPYTTLLSTPAPTFQPNFPFKHEKPKSHQIPHQSPNNMLKLSSTTNSAPPPRRVGSVPVRVRRVRPADRIPSLLQRQAARRGQGQGPRVAADGGREGVPAGEHGSRGAQAWRPGVPVVVGGAARGCLHQRGAAGDEV